MEDWGKEALKREKREEELVVRLKAIAEETGDARLQISGGKGFIEFDDWNDALAFQEICTEKGLVTDLHDQDDVKRGAWYQGKRFRVYPDLNQNLE